MAKKDTLSVSGGAADSSPSRGSQAPETKKQLTAERLLAMGPTCRARDIEELNALFPAYIFRRKGTGEIWTTCCRKHVRELIKNSPIWYEPHVREPRHVYMHTKAEDHWARCPFCGRVVKVKDLQYTGRRENLTAYRKAVILRWWRGHLWAVALNLRKDYPSEACLTAPPGYGVQAVYRYDADGYWTTKHHWYWGWSNPKKICYTDFKDRTADRPFPYDTDAYEYAVIGLDARQKTPLKYIPTAGWVREQGEITAFLHAALAYPRSVELLLKAGLDGPVKDLALRGVKNAYILDWDAEDPRRAFKVSPQEVREWLETESRDVKALALYRKLRRSGERVSVAEAVGLYEFTGACWNIDHYLVTYHLPLVKLWRYLDGRPGYRSASQAWIAWRDYVDAAEVIGLALHRSDVLLPKTLGEAHDRAVAERRRVESERREAAERARLQAVADEYKERRLKDLKRRYEYAADGVHIRVPETCQEIQQEGRALEHCVGGYAERHMQGRTVILFLRKDSAPDKSWLTIEMDGARLRQIHGYRNEGAYTSKRIAPDPRETMRWWLDPWLAWVAGGSRRKKNGTPIVPTKEDKTA